jgi:hypothetical protein
MQQMEHDAMTGERRQDKSAAIPRNPSATALRDGLPCPPRQPPQIRSPLLGDGPELVRDSHC